MRLLPGGNWRVERTGDIEVGGDDLVTDPTVYKRKSVDKYVAYLPGTQLEMARAAMKIAHRADALLSARGGKTSERHHNLPSPTIHVVKGSKLDFFVLLEADAGPGGDGMGRAIGIELGHRPESRAKNRSGPWGQSRGLHVLRDAATYVSYEEGWSE